MKNILERSTGRLPFVTALLIAASMVAPTLASTSWALPVARLRNVKPTVQVHLARGKSFQAVSSKQAVNFGDTIRTGKNGKAEVLFTNGTRVAMNGDSQIQIVAPESKSSPLVIRVFGALSEVFVRPRGNTQVRTAAAIAAARGTAFLLRMVDENTATVIVTEDEVDFFNDAGQVLVSQGQQSTAVAGRPPSPPVAVDASGELAWTAEIAGLPVEYETFLTSPDLDRAEQNVAQNPDDAALQIQLGDARRAAGDVAGARAAYERALQTAPDDAANAAAARVGLALAALSLSNFDGARAALQPISQQAQARAVLGLIELQSGNYPVAITELQSALEQNPNLYQAYALLALAQLSQNHLEAARAASRQAVELEPRSALAQSTLSSVLFFSGREWSREAEQAANRAVALNPNLPLALLVHGRVLLLQDEPDEAAAAFAAAAALMPHSEVAQREWATSLLRQDKPQSAAKAYRRALAINPDSVEAHTGLGVSLLRQGQVAQARVAQQRALEIDGDNATARSNFAALLIEEGNLAEARTQLEAGIIAAPTRGILYARLSEVSLFQQRLVDAQEFARKAVALAPDSAIAYYQLGRVHLELDRLSQAVLAFRKAVLLDRDFAEARYALGYARELVETGRDPSRPAAAAGAGALNSVARALNIQNLQTPGAEHRLQAAIQDPTVVRTATRSYGDTEIKVVAGENGVLNADVSHLRLHSNSRGVVGVTAERENFDDINDRENSDFSANRFGIVFGQKAQDSPSAIFASAQYERLKEGLNKGNLPAFIAPSRTEARKPRILVGGNWQNRDDRRTRALFQYVRPNRRLVNPLFGDTQDDEVNSYNAELRHDRTIGRSHFVSAGVFGGERKRDLRLVLAGFPPFFPDIEVKTDADLSLLGAYLRNEFRHGHRLRIIGELKVQRFNFQSTSTIAAPAPVSSSAKTIENTVLLPTFIADHQISRSTGVRFRLRRLFGSARDFELLSPTDTFLAPLNNLPELGGAGTGTSVELEADHTFPNGSFLRIGFFQQRLKDALAPSSDGSGAVVSRALIRGVRMGYEGSITDDTNIFLNVGYNHARDEMSGGGIANIPQWTGEAGLHYLNRSGWFLQPSVFHSASRLRSDRSRAGGFTVVNLRLGKRLGLRGSGYIELRNAFDQPYEIFEVEQPGRQLRLGLVGRF